LPAFFNRGRIIEMVRVAFDVSSAAPEPGQPSVVTGVGRVTEELFKCLRVNPDLDLKIVGGFAGDWNPMITSLAARKWASTVVKLPIPSLAGYRTRSRLGELAAETLYRFQERLNRSRSSKRSGALQRIGNLALAVLRRFAHSRVDWGLGPDQIDVFHCTFRAAPDWLSPAVPRVTTIHDVLPLQARDEYGPAVVGTLESVLASLEAKRDVVTAVSQFTKDDFCSLSGFPPERVVVAPLSAGDRFRPVNDRAQIAGLRARLGLGEKPFLLSVSNPQPRKNLPLLVRSFYIALRRLPSWEGNLVLVGEAKAGWGTEVIQEEIRKEPEFARRVIRAGAVSDEDLARLYGTCEAFVFPSISEGFGLPVLEAMKCGAPVICSNSSSLPEVAGDAAILVDPKDEVALAEAIVGLLSNPARRNELVALSIRQASKFSWESSAERVAQAYRMALNLVGTS
jgi:glycosyltransferase involved in cell wall biosynthesis